jgi:hypothetical protein
MWRLASFLRVRGLQRGVFGGNRYWFAIWAGLGAASFFHKRLGKHVVSERIALRPGETIVIRDTGLPWEALEANES